MEGTDESSLSDGTASLSIRTAIEQFPLLKSIFHLLRYFSSFTEQKMCKKYAKLAKRVEKHPKC